MGFLLVEGMNLQSFQTLEKNISEVLQYKSKKRFQNHSLFNRSTAFGRYNAKMETLFTVRPFTVCPFVCVRA